MDRREELYKLAKNCDEVLKDKYNVKRIFLIGSLVRGFVHESSD